MTWEHPAEPPRPYLGAYYHTRDNLQERYGITFDLEAYEALCEQLREQDFAGVFKHPCVQSIDYKSQRAVIRWRVFSVPVKLVWNYHAGLVITALPLGRARTDWMEDNHFRKQQQRHQRAYKRRPKHRSRQ